MEKNIVTFESIALTTKKKSFQISSHSHRSRYNKLLMSYLLIIKNKKTKNSGSITNCCILKPFDKSMWLICLDGKFLMFSA